MKLCIRAHDLGVTGTESILQSIQSLGIDGVQMVCYKAYGDIPQQPGAITAQKAEAIGEAFRAAEKCIPLVGAYFNCVHSNREKAAMGEQEELVCGEYKLTYQTVTSSRFDSTRFKKDHADLAAAYTKATSYRRFSVR